MNQLQPAAMIAELNERRVNSHGTEASLRERLLRAILRAEHPIKALHNLDQEIILGMDLCKLFDVDAQFGRGVWRTREGRWRPFAKPGEEENSAIHAECAGISELSEDEREQVERLVDRGRS